MKVIDPTTFTTSMLVSTTAVETTVLWSSATTYAVGAKVRFGTRLYESIVANNLNKQPDTNAAAWADAGPTNPMAMFDSQVSTATSGTSPLTVVIDPGMLDCIGLVGLDVTTVEITVANKNGTEVETFSDNLAAGIVNDWYDYFFEPFEQRDTYSVFNIGRYASTRVTIKVTSATGTPKIGGVVFGTSQDIGYAQYGWKTGTEDYSKVEIDEFGTATLTKRKSAKIATGEVEFPKSEARRIFRLMDKLVATPTLWVPNEDDPDLDFLTIYGIRKSFDLTVPYPLHFLCSLELRSMI